MKIFFTYSDNTKEGFDSHTPLVTSALADESVEEIQGENVLERVPQLALFIEECYRILKFGGKATFSSPYFNHSRAWLNPFTVRGISEMSLNFADKKWREQNKYSEHPVVCDFEVVGNFAIEQSYMSRSDEARMFGMKHYSNVAQAVLLILTKRQLESNNG